MPTSRTTMIHRALGAVDAEHRAAMPGWRRLLADVFRGDEALPPAQRAHLLGVPGRRQVLRLGATTLVGAAVLAACGDDDAPPATTEDGDGDGDGPGDPDEDVETGDEEPSAERDIVLLNTALSLEVLAVDTYQVLLESELVTSATTIDVATVFQSHHAQHREAIAAVVEEAGGEPFLTANPVVRAAFVDPLIFNAASEADLVGLAWDLEQTAAQTYVHAATALSAAALRGTAMSISGVEARHAVILDRLADLDRESPAVYPAESPLPSDAIIPG